jgi:hypothetical protein
MDNPDCENRRCDLLDLHLPMTRRERTPPRFRKKWLLLSAVLLPIPIWLPGWSAPIPCATPAFQAPRVKEIPEAPRELVAADFNGDRFPDLAIAHPGSGVTVILRQPDGSQRIAPATGFQIPGASVAAGDLNRDGRMDLVVGGDNETGNSLFVLLGNGDGTFQKPREYDAGRRVLAVTAGDLDGDGVLDIAAVNYGESGSVVVFHGVGDGTLRLGERIPTYSGPVSIRSGDFNADGRLDLVVATVTAWVAVFPGRGDGTFLPAISRQSDWINAGMTLGDFNGDHRPDLATSTGYAAGFIQIWSGNGDGSFAEPRLVSIEGSPIGIDAADLNRDGRTDLVVALPKESRVAVLYGLGNGEFQPALSADALPGAVTLTTLDPGGDGLREVAVGGAGAMGGAWVTVLTPRDDGSLRSFSSQTTYAGGTRVTGVAFADLTNDGLGDLVQVTSEGLSVAVGLADGGFGPSGFPYRFNAAPFAFASADFNQDGLVDFAALDATALLSLRFGDGAGRFKSLATTRAGSEPVAVAAGDLDADGVPDLAIADQRDGTAVVLYGVGDGTFHSGEALPIGRAPNSVVIEDFDADGVPDLGVAFLEGVAILRGRGDGTFHEAMVSSAGWFPSAIRTGDLDRDGKPDVVILGRTAPDSLTGAMVILGRGDGTFGAPVHHPVGPDPDTLVIVDLDGDGDADLAVGNYASGSVSVLAGGGDGSFEPVAEYYAGAHLIRFEGKGFQRLGVGDVDRDGRPDLLVGTLADRTVILRNSCEPPRMEARLALTRSPSGLRVAWPASGDFVLQSATQLVPPDWQAAAESPEVVDGERRITLQPGASARYFRLAQAPAAGSGSAAR